MNKIVHVTGASSGIVEATARILAAAGMTVVLTVTYGNLINGLGVLIGTSSSDRSRTEDVFGGHVSRAAFPEEPRWHVDSVEVEAASRAVPTGRSMRST